MGGKNVLEQPLSAAQSGGEDIQNVGNLGSFPLAGK